MNMNKSLLCRLDVWDRAIKLKPIIFERRWDALEEGDVHPESPGVASKTSSPARHLT